jgi:D-alanyl-lipoteichoic acid acyltransferase DltB (MBOAT superfamily)
MESASIDLYSVRFWAAVAVAIAVMVPLASASARRVALAAFNLGFLAVVLREGVVGVLAGAVIAFLVLRALPMPRLGPPALALGGSAVLGLFLIHKLPGLAVGTALSQANPILTVVGFSYVALRWVDVARAVRERRHPPPDFAATVNYLLPFHMLAAGPIQAYDDFVAQPAVPPPPDFNEALGGLERIIAGMFKKYVLANLIEKTFLTGFLAGGPYFLLELQLNYLWLFLDFSAYSDIAVGIGRLIGVATPENFNRPYLARNPIDYWDRWHMSLSQFIRRNLFIPIQMALMRRTDGAHALGIASLAFTASFLLCGLWHNIGWNWLAWGAYQAAGLVVCNLYKAYLLKRLGRKGLNRYLANPWIKAAAVVLTFEFIAVSLVLVTVPWGSWSWASR